jgi:outer membrane immunogenic protein
MTRDKRIFGSIAANSGCSRGIFATTNTSTGQLGYAWDRWLAYAKGGWAEASTHLFVNGPVTASNSQDPNGWTIGGGVDYAVWPNLIFGVEYDHFSLNYKPFVAPVSNGGAPLVVANTSRLTLDQVVARLSYKFN